MTCAVESKATDLVLAAPRRAPLRTGFFVLALASVGFAGCSADDDGGSGKQNPGGTAGTGVAGTGGGGVSGGVAGFGTAGIGSTAGTGGTAGIGGTAGTGSTGELLVIDNCPGSVSPASVAALQDPNVQTVAPMRWLYPYDRTVFPRGLEAPLLQWDEASGSSEAVFVHLKSSLFDYKGCLAPTKPGQLQLPQDIWDTAGAQSRGANDPLTIDLVTIAGGNTSKLPTRQLTFALATLKNAIYYNTYGSALANQMGVVGGVVMRVTPKQTQPDVFLTATNPANCIGCHAVSADGSRMVAEEHVQPGLFEGTGGVYDLANGMLRPAREMELSRAGFSALYPDGSVYLTTGRPAPGPFAGGNVTGTFGPEDTKLVDTSNGMTIANSGAPKYALMPMFATDGKKVVFNHLADAGTGGHTLAVMDFDRGTNTFSNLTSLFTDATKFPAWPSFMPDVAATNDELNPNAGRKVVFGLATNGDYVTQDAPANLTPHNADLYWVDVTTGTAAPLARAGGFDGSTNFMPYGDRDAHRDFLPTVSPVAAGGYFWVFFTSRRQYGNELVYDNEYAPEAKKIWVAAIDINATPGSDPSHPAFFLPGQEHESGNIRAFAALSPCKVDGESCETGIDCCSGFCLDGICGVPEARCSVVDEKCETSADCCPDMGLSCIGGFCGFIIE